MSNPVEVDGMSFPSAIKAIEFFSKEKELSEKLFEEIANKIKTVSKYYVKQVLLKKAPATMPVKKMVKTAKVNKQLSNQIKEMYLCQKKK